MDKSTPKPIFYDATKKRWSRVKYSSFFALLAITLILSGFVASLFFDHQLHPTPPLITSFSTQCNPVATTINTHQDSFRMIENFSSFRSDNPIDTSCLINSPTKDHHLKKWAFLRYHDIGSMNSLTQHLSDLDGVFIGGAHLSSAKADITEEEPQTLAAIVQEIHQQNPSTNTILTLDNAWLENTAEFLADPLARQSAIQYEALFLTQYHFNGIHLHFENLDTGSRDDFHQFIDELSSMLHAQNLSLFVTVNTDDPTFDLPRIANSADYLLTLGYATENKNNAAEPLASLDWFYHRLNASTMSIPPEKLIVAVANAGFDWNDQNNTIESISFTQAMQLAKLAKAKINLDPQSGNPFFHYKAANTGVHTVWFLDAVTLFNQLVLAEAAQIHGVALWRLGTEDPSAWAVYNTLKTDKNTALKLREINTENALSTSGKTGSEIFAINQLPQSGRRIIHYDESSHLITHEQYSKIPTLYNIHGYDFSDSKKIALTFDDGPDPIYTPQILDILKETHTPATFFLIGRNVLKNPELAQREIAEGHDIGNHTYTHPNITASSKTELSMELAATKRLLETVTGRSTQLFRAPYGIDSSPTTLEQIKRLSTITQLGYYIVEPGFDSEDWKKPGTEIIANSVINEIHRNGGNIILFHDAGGMRQQTVDALPKIINTLKSEGYQFAAVSELMDAQKDIILPVQPYSWQMLLSQISFNLIKLSKNSIWAIYLFGIFIVVLRLFVLTSLSLYQKWKSLRDKNILPLNPELSLAVIVPAHNEAASIVQTIQSLLNADRPKHFEIIVINDGSTDETLQILKQHFSKHPLIKILSQKNSGKCVALNNGLSQTHADFVTIIDADTIIDCNTLLELLKPFGDPKVGAVAGNIRVANQDSIMAKWQIIEYARGQSLDRRSLSVLDAVMVVPGALGCWRRTALNEAGGFTPDTLAEDADTTLKIKKCGYRIAVAEKANAYTEVPESIKLFLRQRFRWMYGTYQVVWKHINALFRPRYGVLGMIALPNLIIMHIVLPVISPLIDLILLSMLLYFSFKSSFGYPITADDIIHLKSLGFYYLLFTSIDLLTTLLALLLDGEEKKRNILWLIPQRFFYKQLIDIIAYRSLIAALHGREVFWGRMTRKLTAETSI